MNWALRRVQLHSPNHNQVVHRLFLVEEHPVFQAHFGPQQKVFPAAFLISACIQGAKDATNKSLKTKGKELSYFQLKSVNHAKFKRLIIPPCEVDITTQLAKPINVNDTTAQLSCLAKVRDDIVADVTLVISIIQSHQKHFSPGEVQKVIDK